MPGAQTAFCSRSGCEEGFNLLLHALTRRFKGAQSATGRFRATTEMM